MIDIAFMNLRVLLFVPYHILFINLGFWCLV